MGRAEHFSQLADKAKWFASTTRDPDLITAWQRIAAGFQQLAALHAVGIKPLDGDIWPPALAPDAASR